MENSEWNGARQGRFPDSSGMSVFFSWRGGLLLFQLVALQVSVFAFFVMCDAVFFW